MNCIRIPYLEQLYLQLDNYHGLFYIMPDFIGKLKKEVIFKEKFE